MSRALIAISILLNILLAGTLIYLYTNSDPVVAKVENSVGNRRVVRASQVRRELASRHGEDVLGDLAGRQMVTLGADESSIILDAEEVEARWFLWSQEPGVKASLDGGETTELELRDRLVTLVLLDQLTLNELNPGERESVLRHFYDMNKRDLEEVKLRHILLESKKEANEVAERLGAGVDFGELAKRFSLDPLSREQGGNLGWKKRDDLKDDLAPLLFLIPEGRASKPMSSRHGWHIFLVEDKRTEYKDVKDTARREWCELRRPDTLAKLRKRFQVVSPDKAELVKKLRPVFDPPPPGDSKLTK